MADDREGKCLKDKDSATWAVVGQWSAPITTGAYQTESNLPNYSSETVTTGQALPGAKLIAVQVSTAVLEGRFPKPAELLESGKAEIVAEREEANNEEEDKEEKGDSEDESGTLRTRLRSRRSNTSTTGPRPASASTSGGQGSGEGKRRVAIPQDGELLEQRRQKRLAKNRLTAAASRQRKRDHLSTTEQLVKRLEDDNERLTKALADRERELSDVKEQLASFNRSASGEVGALQASESAAGTNAAAQTSPSPLPNLAAEHGQPDLQHALSSARQRSSHLELAYSGHSFAVPAAPALYAQHSWDQALPQFSQVPVCQHKQTSEFQLEPRSGEMPATDCWPDRDQYEQSMAMPTMGQQGMASYTMVPDPSLENMPIPPSELVPEQYEGAGQHLGRGSSLPYDADDDFLRDWGRLASKD